MVQEKVIVKASKTLQNKPVTFGIFAKVNEKLDRNTRIADFTKNLPIPLVSIVTY